MVLKRLQKLDEEGLRKQLLLAPEVALDASPGSTEGLVQVAGRMQAVGLIYPGPALIARVRPDLVGLPLRMRFDCQLGKEPAESLQALSRKLRTHLEASLPPGGSDPRPDPGRLREKLLGKSGAEWLSPDAIPALLQLLQAENKPVRLVLVEVLSKIEGRRSTQALAVRAVVDLSPEVREAALRALQERSPKDYRDLLLAGLSYPWVPVQQHAAEALLALKDKEAVPQLVKALELPPATVPFPVTRGKKEVLVTRELVRVNHLLNCALCHAPSFSRGDLVRGAIPRTDRALPPPTSAPYYEGAGRMVRADITYLRQDFSVVQPVLRTPPSWPTHQRFDYLVRTRQLTPRERKLFEKVKLDLPVERLREPVLFALRGLTGKGLGSDPKEWKELVTMRKPDSERPSVPAVTDRVAGDWTQFLGLRDFPVAAPTAEPDPGQLGKDLVKAPRAEQDRLLGLLRDGKGVEFTDALAAAIPKLGDEARKRARTVLAERLTRLKVPSLRDKLADPAPEVRRAAALACAMRELRDMVPELIKLLEDKDAIVPPAARAALRELSGKDFGPSPSATARERAEALGRWREWWKGHERSRR